ncbi:MAG TPA: SDR family oxidoreductase [Chloroflexota bacterium]|nr:SDR family oxidoreductase [Chloroflexota bacterium]
MRLQGKTALVTGGTSGIGRAIAEAFAREGARVAVTGRDEARGRAAVEAIEKVGGDAIFLRADLASLDEVRGLARAATEALVHVDILVNNAGVFPFGPTEATDEATFDATIDTNVRAPFFLTAALAPAMAARGTGKIINITTMAAYFGIPGMAAYGASKAAVDLLTKAWAAEYGPRGVNVNAISPGPTRTEGTAAMGEGLDQLASQAPAGRPASPEEIAAAAVYLASAESDFVHGATLHVDGGRVAA